MKTVDFKDFDDRFRGYVCIEGKTIYVPAIMSKVPGKGHLRDFVKVVKRDFRVVKFTNVNSPLIKQILVKYGFKHGKEFADYYNDFVDVMTWRRGS